MRRISQQFNNNQRLESAFRRDLRPNRPKLTRPPCNPKITASFRSLLRICATPRRSKKARSATVRTVRGMMDVSGSEGQLLDSCREESGTMTALQGLMSLFLEIVAARWHLIPCKLSCKMASHSTGKDEWRRGATAGYRDLE
jgi:hypothetical protein